MKKTTKKKLAVVLAATLSLSAMLTGCGGSKETGAQPDVAKDFTVGFVYNGAANDGGYSQTHDEARQAIEEKLGVSTLVTEKVGDTDSEKVFRDMVDQGADMIFSTSFGHMEYMMKVANENPDVKFMHGTGYMTSENMGNFFGRVYQARYLTGLVAGMETENNKIGYVAAMPIPEVIRGINAFTLGVREVNPEATVEVIWTNTWYDPAKEKEAAKALIDKGVDVIAQHQDTTSVQLAAEEAGIKSIGYHKDASVVAPNAALTSAIWNWENFYTAQVEAALNGTWEPEAYWGQMADGVVDIAPYGPSVSEETKTLVDAKKAEIIESESDRIFVGPIKDQSGAVKVQDGQQLTDEELLTMEWFVEGVVGKL